MFFIKAHCSRGLTNNQLLVLFLILVGLVLVLESLVLVLESLVLVLESLVLVFVGPVIVNITAYTLLLCYLFHVLLLEF